MVPAVSERGPQIGEGEIRRGPPLGRHVAAIGVVLVLVLLFWWVHPDPTDSRNARLQWNRILADTSFVLLCLILMLGPVARFVPRLRRLVPWGRELGIAMFVTAGLHVVILIGDFSSLSDAFFGAYGFIADESFWTAVNWVGLFALGYALVLAATSNDLSHRLLGRGWKFLQRQTYTLFVLTWLHTAGFVLFAQGESSVPFISWFWIFTTLAVVTQFSGFVHTVRSPRGPSPQKAPGKSRAVGSKAASVAAVKWVAVTALWGILTIGFYQLGFA